MSSSLVVPASTPVGTPAVVDTKILSLTTLMSLGLSMWKGIKAIQMTYDFQLQSLDSTAGVAAVSVISDALYQDDETSTGAPSVAGTPFLHVNELVVASTPIIYPERIFFRRMNMVSIGQNFFYPTAVSDQTHAPHRIRLNANLLESLALWHRLEASNSTTSDRTLTFQAMGAVAYRSIP